LQKLHDVVLNKKDCITAVLVSYGIIGSVFQHHLDTVCWIFFSRDGIILRSIVNIGIIEPFPVEMGLLWSRRLHEVFDKVYNRLTG